MTLKSIPTAALRFTTTTVEVGEQNGSEAKTAPFRMVARSGQPITHWYFGKVAHDLSGMYVANGKSRISVDWEHGGIPLGYANHFDFSSGDLVIAGTLIPYDGDKAEEIIYKAKNGVPFEASISWGGEETVIEEYAEGQTTTVNGYEFAGPGVVVRKWPLRSMAICREGADQNTSTEFTNNETINIEVKNMGEVETVENQAVVEATQNETKEVAEATAVEATAVAEEVAVEPTVEVTNKVEESQGTKYMRVFGESQGAIYFAKGLNFETAMLTHLEWQQQQISELKTIAQSERGFTAPVVALTERGSKKDLVDCIKIK